MRAQEARNAAPDRVICQSQAMRQVMQSVGYLCASTLTPRALLLKGEAGTGKSFIARTIHHNGPRRTAPLVELNCATIPEESVEETLWGSGSGAKSGLYGKGLIRAAQGGTLLLRKVDQLHPSALARLVDLIEAERDQPTAGLSSNPASVQLIVCSHRDLAHMAERGFFQLDLLVQLNEATMTIPPLRQRRADCIALAELFLHEFAREEGYPPKRLSDAAKLAISHYPWPGNVCQLRNAIERVSLLEDEDLVQPAHLQLPNLATCGTKPQRDSRSSTIRKDCSP